jgi:hypothetical protein
MELPRAVLVSERFSLFQLCLTNDSLYCLRPIRFLCHYFSAPITAGIILIGIMYVAIAHEDEWFYDLSRT